MLLLSRRRKVEDAMLCWAAETQVSHLRAGRQGALHSCPEVAGSYASVTTSCRRDAAATP